MPRSVGLNFLRQAIPSGWRARVADWRGRGVYSHYANENHFIFIHIPKTAGVAIVKALSIDARSHLSWRDYQSGNPAKFRRMFKFSVVRNPWDRLVSSYSFLKQGGLMEDDDRWAEENLARFDDFGDFVRQWVNRENVWQWVHFVPQHHYIADDSGRLMVDFVARFETLGDDLQEIARRIGRPIGVEVVNKSSHDHYTKYYDAETREIVRVAYEEDVRLLEYGFER